MNHCTILRQRPLALLGLAMCFSMPCTSAVRAQDDQDPVDLTRVQTLWGRFEPAPDGTSLIQRLAGNFPVVLRLPVNRPADGAWILNARVTRLMDRSATRERRQAEDVGILLDDGIVQIWWGGLKQGGIRVTRFGQPVAANDQAFLSGSTHLIGIERDRAGRLRVLLDGRVVVDCRIPLSSRRRPIDCASRNSTIRWSDVRGRNLHAGQPDPQEDWQLRRGEPSFNPEEAVLNGYQPVLSHLWNRWLIDLTPAPGEWPGLPWLDAGGESPVTHGPMLGKPDPHAVGVWCRTTRPMDIEVVGGPSDDTAEWTVLGEIRTSAAQGNTGHVRVESDRVTAERVNYSLRANGKIVDIREDGEWPTFAKRWFAPENLSAARLAVWCGDDLCPVPRAVYPQAWRDRQAQLDLMVHLGDFVYEQAYRRRVEVSRLDYLPAVAPSHPGGLRVRHAPLVGVLDDHEMFNDVVGNGEVFLFRQPPGDRRPQGSDHAWRISSRDVGFAAWEEFVGWGTPIRPELEKCPLVIAQGELTKGGIRVADPQARGLLMQVDPSLATTLVIWPRGNPVRDARRGVDLAAIRPECAGVYQFRGFDEQTGVVSLDPRAKGEGSVRFSISRPRYSSMRLGSAELLLIDTRTMRTLFAEDPSTPGPTVLGARQLDWLLGRIQSTDAPVILIASSITWKFHNSFTLTKRDSWTGYAHERNRILEACRNTGKTVLLLSGDLHNASVRQLDKNVWEVLCGSWSNQGFQPLKESTEPVAGLPDNGFLWAAPESPGINMHWASYVTFLTVEGNAVRVEVLNLASNEIEFTTTLQSE